MNKLAVTLVSMLALVLPAAAQLQVGDNLALHLSGDLSTGYNGNYANLSSSEHSMAVGGDANLNGYYYSPSFLSFALQPFYNQSRDNSNYQSITNSSGFGSNVALFGGSRFPGSINYSKTYNSEGQYAIPGQANVTTHGDSSALGINWGVSLPSLPTINFGFSEGSNAYSVYGSSAQGTSHFDTFHVSTAYQLAGFSMNGNYQYVNVNGNNPQVFADQSAQKTTSGGSSYSFGAGHKFPFNGAFSVNASRSQSNGELNGVSDYHGTVDQYGGSLSVNPITSLNMGANVYYTDNLEGTLLQGFVESGAAIQPLTNMNSHSLGVTAFANYLLPALHMSLSGSTDYRSQYVFGNLESTSSGGTATYSNNLLKGYVSAVVSFSETSVSPGNTTTAGLLTSLTYSKSLGRWNVAGSGSFSRNQETALIGYSSSSYGYSGSLNRNFSRNRHWGISASGAKSGLGNVSGTQSYSQSYSTVASTKFYSVSGSYATSSGNAIVTNSGLTAVTGVVPILLPTSVTLYGGHSVSAGAGMSPIRGLTIAVSYSTAWSNTTSNAISSKNTMNQFNVQETYLLRKLYLRSGYSRLSQGFTASGGPASMVSSYYVGISRWFNFF